MPILGNRYTVQRVGHSDALHRRAPIVIALVPSRPAEESDIGHGLRLHPLDNDRAAQFADQADQIGQAVAGTFGPCRPPKEQPVDLHHLAGAYIQLALYLFPDSPV